MNNNQNQHEAFSYYQTALSCFQRREFAQANRHARQYKKLVNYDLFETHDHRSPRPVSASVIVVTRNRGQDLLACLDSLDRQSAPNFEVIVADNGGNEDVRDALLAKDLLLVVPPISLTPSEARNAAAYFARSNLLIFLDDDALAEPDFVSSVCKAFEQHDFLGIRGKIMPRTSGADNSFAGLYDLGEYPIPAVLDLEGNMAVPTQMYRHTGGMNPLLFGNEGLELSFRLIQTYPEKRIYYWPSMRIRHDYARGQNLVAKRKRQALAWDYFERTNPGVTRLRQVHHKALKSLERQMPGQWIRTLPRKAWFFLKDLFLTIRSRNTPNLKHDTGRKPYIQNYSCSKPDSAPHQKNILESKIHSLEKELERTRSSFSFRLGHLLGEAITSPLQRGLILPFRLASLIREYVKGKKYNPDIPEATSVSGHELRNEMRYTRSGREEHRFRVFEKHRPVRSWKNSTLCIACLASDHLLNCLKFEADIIRLDKDSWQELLEGKTPDFLLVQSELRQGLSSKEHASGSLDNLYLEEILSFCQNRKIPTVFWDTEDKIHADQFLALADKFDKVFVADPESAAKYQKRLKKDTELLGPAIQPALHNPLKHAETSLNGFTILLDGWSDLLEHPDEFDELKPILDKGLHIVESRYRLVANKLDDLPEYRKNIMGCISRERLLTALRHYKVLIMPEKSLSSSLNRSWRAMEALACGCSVVTSDNTLLDPVQEMVIKYSDNQELQARAMEILGDETKRLKQSLLARRKLFSAHTYAHRIGTICRYLNIEHDWEEHPLVSVITPTKRPDLIPSCLEQFQKQSYPNKELLIMINSSDIEFEKIQAKVDQVANARVFQVHQEKNIGVCLNLGVSKAGGEYWFKMDDDDFYGQYYISDMVHLAEGVDFHIMGKPPAFIYLEGEDRIYLRNRALQGQYLLGNTAMPHLCGATLGGKREKYPGFSENSRACVDTDFVEDSRNMGHTVISCDIWNFIAFRGADKIKHTWRHHDKTITRNSSFYCHGKDKNKIMV